MALPTGFYNSHLQTVRLIARNSNLTSTSNVFSDKFTMALKKIVFLDLSGNHLSVVLANEFSGVNNVLNLNLGHNHLTTLQVNAFDGLIKLAVLNLANNQLMRIPTNSFGQLPKLQTLFLNNNNISTLAACTLATAENIANLNFKSNSIQQSCPADSGVQKSFHEISIAGNPWNCSYLKELWSDFKNRSIKILDESNIDERLCGGLPKVKKIVLTWVMIVLLTLGVLSSIAILFIAIILCSCYNLL
jgi:Leucine-rich repeat (LRR) protein